MSEKCTRCAGCGKIANTDDGEPWSYWMRLPIESAAAVVLGIVKPIPCPQCGSTGWLTPEQVRINDLRTLLSHVSDVLCAIAFSVDDDRLLTLNDEVIAGLMAAAPPVGEESTDDQSV